jgi:hypothetical protein
VTLNFAISVEFVPTSEDLQLISFVKNEYPSSVFLEVEQGLEIVLEREVQSLEHQPRHQKMLGFLLSNVHSGELASASSSGSSYWIECSLNHFSYNFAR